MGGIWVREGRFSSGLVGRDGEVKGVGFLGRSGRRSVGL